MDKSSPRDLFEWAEMRASCVVIDATRLFQRRTNNFIRLILIGYRPPTSGGADPVSLAAVRAIKQRQANSHHLGRYDGEQSA